MARVNVGINPKYLTDQHLIAESVEITMITGQLKKHNYQIKSDIPQNFNLEKGHMTFFKNKIIYLKDRLESVNHELKNRGFKTSTFINLSDYPIHLCNNWIPAIQDSKIVRERIVQRLTNPLRAKPNFHKYYRIPISNRIDQFTSELVNSPLYQY